MAEEEAADNAFVDYVQSACVVEASEVGVGFTEAREKDEFSGQSSHCIVAMFWLLKTL